MTIFGRKRKRDICRQIGRERIKKNVEKDDFLLSQIDEFREKAKQLQSLLATKETKVQELQEIVEEREGKAKALSSMLDEKKDAADRVVSGVRTQIDGMVGQVDYKMKELIGQVDAKMKELNEAFAERLAENALNSSEQHEEVKKLIDSQNEEIRAIISEQNEKTSESLTGIQEPFDKLKGELNDKIHTENVKCYRNIQTLFEESDKKLELVKSEMLDLLAVKGYMKVVCAVSVVNLVGVLALLLHAFGLF